MKKLAAALIVRDCADTLPACLESIRPHVDYLCVVDTGSSDDTPKIAQEYATHWERYTGCNVHPLTGQQDDKIWDFADARNRSFALLPDDTDVCWWMDGDDRLEGGENLRPAAEQMPPTPFVLLAPYEYSYSDPAMTMPNCIHWRERLISRPKEFHWLTPCHEVCQPRAGVAGHDHLPSVLLKHRAQVSKSPREPGRNKRILEAYLKRVGESDVRAMYYMGVEYARHNQFGLARKTLRRYVELSGWSDEQCLAQLELGRIALAEGDCTEALRWANAALDTKSWPDPYWLKVKAFCRMADEGHQAQFEYHCRRAMAWAERGRDLEDAQTVLFYNPTERFDVERYVAKIYGMAGDVDAAAEACRRGLKGMPGDADLMEQLRSYEKVRIGRDLDTALSRLVHLGAIGESVKQAIEGLLTGQLQVAANDGGVTAQQAGPHPFARIGTGEPVDVAGLPPIPEGKLDIVIVTGPAMEEWSPRTIAETGIGGSETMAWEMARHLAKRGHRVRHYGWCRPEQEGIYEGVHWLDSARYRDIECDALVVSRLPDLVQCVGGTKAKARLLWIHDVHCGQALTPAHALRFDRFLCLSKWHKEFFCSVYPFIDPERVTVTRNGIDLGLFKPHESECTHVHDDDCGGNPPRHCEHECEDCLLDAYMKRNPHRAVYSSSPDRGLQTALELWPLVRAEVPDAELHVFYGFDGLRKIQPPLADVLEAKAKATAGVVLHGRVHPTELAREFLRSGVWFYPTWFCCHPDTRISVPGDHTNGTPTVRIADMVGAAPFPVYAFNEAENRFQIATCTKVWETKIADELVALELDSGETLRVTPDHLVLTFDGDWVEAGTLKPGDSLRALHYRYNVAIRDGNGRWTDEHRLVAEWKEGRRIARGEHVNHLDPRRLNNLPEMLEVLTAAEHFSKTHKGKKLSRRHVEKKAAIMRATLAALSPEEKTRRGKRAGKAAWDAIRSWTEEKRAQFYAGRVERRRQTIANSRALPLPYDQRDGHNHKVLSVTRIPGSIPVYDMEVEGLHNFVADGVVVHNCETSCITAMQAQAAGLRCIATPIAALNETVGKRGALVPNPPGPVNIAQGFECAPPSEEFKKEFVEKTCLAMRALDPENQTEFGFRTWLDRALLQRWARENFSIDTLASDWSAMLTELCAADQMPRFYVDPAMAAVARETDEAVAA